jgi:hypothetical protein
MRSELFIGGCLALVVCVLALAGCKKAKKAAAVDPWSAEGVMMTLLYEAKMLNQAGTRNDFDYIEDHSYYFGACLDALAKQLKESQKRQLERSFSELKGLSDILYRSAGSHHAEATQDGLARLAIALKELEKQFQQMKEADPELRRRPQSAVPAPRSEASPALNLIIVALKNTAASVG